MISSKKYVDETLKANNLVANKSLGQNFLVESEIAIEIVNSANIDKDTCVIEIGPGLGALTEIALEKASIILGEYGCKGYNTYGPWKLIGGMNKKHPTETEIQECVKFYVSYCRNDNI